MRMKSKCFSLLFSILGVVYSVEGVTLFATVHLNGIRGSVTLEQSNGGNTNCSIELTGLSNSHSWSFRSNRMLYDVSDPCTDSLLGSAYTPAVTGTTPGTSNHIINNADLPDIQSLYGRSIIFTNSATLKRTCATIEAEKDGSLSSAYTAIAKLQSVIGGTVYFRQSKDFTVSSIYANVFHLQNTLNATNDDIDWGIYSGTCSSMSSLYNPTGSSGSSCDVNNHANCQIGNLVGKHSKLAVGATQNSAIQSFVDFNLPLSSANSIKDKLLVLKATNGTLLTCAKIVLYKQRKASVMLSRDGVKASLVFTQDSPFDSTSISGNFSGLKSNAGGYHIHKWPVPEKLSLDQLVCSNEHVSGHFNPFNIDTSTDPAPATGTTDQYEIGDISSKFGLLTGLNETTITAVDYNLPLFGINSVIGRSLVIHYSNGSRWVCSNIDYNGQIVSGVATFTYPVIGYIVFSQPTDVELEVADTTILTMLNYGDTTTRTINHNWHVHVQPITNDSLVTTGRCQSVLGHYNPFLVDLEGTYSTECQPSNPLRCEVGDMSGKHGKIAVRSTSGSMERNFFTDVDLPLSGDLKILGKSLVIHVANSGGRLSCANIYTIPNRKVIVKSGSWDKESSSSVSGTFEMESSNPSLFEGLTHTKIAISGLASLAGGYHVHLNPVPLGSSNPCSPASVGGHFNPFGVDPYAGPIDGSGSDDEYEIGDLSRKYGYFMTSKTMVSEDFMDTMLPLRGPNSITGRSVVIHKSSSGAPRWVCGNITEDVSVTKGTLFEARATFADGPLTGTIYLTQYLYSDGGTSDTGVMVDLVAKDGSSTTGHNWHVHEKPVGNDATSGCMTPGLHYNPFTVDTSAGYNECGFTNPLRCEVGDQSSKLGRYDIGSGRKFYTDVYLPIIGKYSVIGKSFVIHNQGGASSRMACADIIPVNTVTPLIMSFDEMNFDKVTMINYLANVLHTSPTNLAVSAPDHEDACMTVNVYITGMEAATIKNDLLTMRDRKDPLLGQYVGTVTCCSSCNFPGAVAKSRSTFEHCPGTHLASILCLLVGFVLQRLWIS